MEISVSTSAPIEVVDVTERVEEVVGDDVDSGVATVFVSHTTAAVVVNEAEPRLVEDIEEFVDGLVPDDGRYRHDEIDDNADSHIRSMLLGPSVTVPVADGALQLGTWQSILFVECDGPRTRTVQVLDD